MIEELDDLPDVYEADRETSDIPINVAEGYKVLELYRQAPIEVYFSCGCYDPEQMASCGEKFYITFDGKLYSDIYVYDSEKAAIRAARRILDEYYRLQAEEYDERV